MSKVVVKVEVLRWALDRSGIAIEDLESKFPKISDWITGRGQPTLRQLEALAKATLTPFGFLFLQEPPEDKLPIPHFRTVDDRRVHRPSVDLLESIRIMQRRQAWMREFLLEQGEAPLPFVGSVQVSERPVVIARRIREVLGFVEEWARVHSNWSNALRALHEAVESAGILVVVNGIVGNNTHRKLDPDEFRGFVLVDDYAPLVFINGVDGKAAQMFTLAHELAHVILGSSAAFDLRQMLPANERTEQACNLVAAEFLVPESVLRPLWPSVRNDSSPFDSIARHFKVSAIVAARRALDLALISRSSFFAFYQAYKDSEVRSSADQPDGGNFYASQNFRVGKRFASAIAQSTREGKLLYSEAYHLTGLYGKTFEKYVNSLGFGGGP